MTGLVYVAIVALWAAVLIPMWLRRHDDDQARRIERHRVALGTLARMSDATDAAHVVAARRRRVILAAAATLGALATAAWVAGFLPGLVVLVAWLPLAAYLPAAFHAERHAARRAAEVALDRRRERHVRRASLRDAPASTHVPPTHAASAHAAPTQATSAHAAPTWDDVFDQTA